MTEALRIAVANGMPIAAGILGLYRPLDATKIVGTVLCITGTAGWFRPVQLGKIFGVPFSDATTSLFFPGIGGRNLAAGITILTLSFLGGRPAIEGSAYRKALGVFLATWELAGASDSWILLQTPGSENLFGHVQNMIVLGVVSYRLLSQ